MASAGTWGPPVTLLACLIVGACGAAGSGWALARGGSTARLGALGGVAALALVAILAAASPTPDLTPGAGGSLPGTLWNGALVPGAYLRVVVVLWAASSIALAALAWLVRGTAGLRGLLPATLAALVGSAVTLAASSAELGTVAAGATGLAAVPAVLASTRPAAPGIAAREVRAAVGTAAVVLAVAAVAPVVSRLALVNPDAATTASGSSIAAAVAFGLLAVALVVAARVGAIPYHVRISALADTVMPGSLPLVAAWLPLPLAAVSVGVAAGVLAPMALPVGSAQALIIVLTLLATLAAALVAFLQDDLRHAVGYLTLADLGLVVLAIAALDPAAWGAARAWLLIAAVTKTALGAWAAVAEDRFETRAVPDLRGWLRSAPVLGVGLALIALATYGLPGWAAMNARSSLTTLAAGAPWSAVLLIASLLTLPAYLRWLWLGVGAPTSHVDRAVPEFRGLPGGRLPARRLALRPPGRGRDGGLPVEQETSEGTEPKRTVDGTPAKPVGPSASGEAAVLQLTSAGAGEPAVATGTAEASQPTGATRPAEATGTARGIEAASATTAVPRRRRRGDTTAGPLTRAAGAAGRHRTGLLSGIVLALALLATLVAYGAFDVAGAAGEPVPAVAGISA